MKVFTATSMVILLVFIWAPILSCAGEFEEPEERVPSCLDRLLGRCARARRGAEVQVRAGARRARIAVEEIAGEGAIVEIAEVGGAIVGVTVGGVTGHCAVVAMGKITGQKIDRQVGLDICTAAIGLGGEVGRELARKMVTGEEIRLRNIAKVTLAAGALGRVGYEIGKNGRIIEKTRKMERIASIMGIGLEGWNWESCRE